MIAGWAAAAPTAVGGATINDLFVDRERAVAMAVYIAGPLIGANVWRFFIFSLFTICDFSGFVIGPIAGGFIAQTIGVKYVFITMSALCSLAALIGIPFLRETYAPVIRIRLAKMSSEPEKVAEAHLPMNKPIWHILWLNLSRPVILLSHSFICFILSLYLAM